MLRDKELRQREEDKARREKDRKERELKETAAALQVAISEVRYLLPSFISFLFAA